MHQGEQEKTASEIIPCTGTFLHLDKVITLAMSQSTYLLDLFWEFTFMVGNKQFW